ncbi:MAG: hypothetical protein IKO14_02830 [Oscillibacter sp.]|nr:hypothetical protein [Oscillibacter sp.]
MRLVTRKRAEQALRLEAALREVTLQGGQVRICLPGEIAPEAAKTNRRIRRMERRRRMFQRILQRLTVAGLIAVILLLAFSIGVEIGRGKQDGGGEAPLTAAANEWRHDNG